MHIVLTGAPAFVDMRLVDALVQLFVSFVFGSVRQTMLAAGHFVVRQLTRSIDMGIMSVRPSVRHVPVLYRNGLTYRHNFFTTR